LPKINVRNKTITCEAGANLRQVLLSHQVPVHNGNAAFINCRGLGTCGTCAVDIEGEVSLNSGEKKPVYPFLPITQKLRDA